MGPSADAVAEARALAVTATPIVASYLLSYGCALVMLMLVGHVSVEALAAVALATMYVKRAQRCARPQRLQLRP